MFGGSTSPLLRHFSGRLIVPELDLNDSNGDLPISPAAVLPSRILLQRVKAVLFLVWGFSCCKISWDSVMRMSEDLQDLFFYEAFMYYNPLFLVTLMVWLWGFNLWVFAQSIVSYTKVFDLDQNHLTSKEIWKCATWMTITVSTSMTAYLYLYSHGEVSFAASQPVLLYAAGVFRFGALCLPNGPSTGLVTYLTLLRSVATIAWFEADSVCGSHSMAIPLVLVFPYMCRFFQCLRQYKDLREKTPLFNALKYSTAIPVIFLSALKYHVILERWTNIYQPLWLFSCAINTLFSFYWDVTRDWDLSSSRIFIFKNPSLISNHMHDQQWVFYWVLGSNLILRCSWTYKLSAHLRHNYLTVFVFTILEMLRRFQWIFFRVDNEWNKMNPKQYSSLPTSEVPEDEDKATDQNV